MKLISTVFLAMLASVSAHANPENSGPKPYFVANCFNCHGTDGKSVSAIPALAGRDKVFLEESLKAYKAGTKQATIMHQLAKGYTDEELSLLADFFSKQK